MPIEPYIEAPFIRTTTQPVSGGIDISAFEQQAQGVSVRNKIKRNASLLPQMGTGKEDFTLTKINFSQSERFEETISFSDRERVISEKYILDPNQFGDTVVVGDYRPIDGALEPFTIRDVASFSSIESSVGKSTKGSLMDGNIDKFGRSDVKNSFFAIVQTDDFDFFLDSADTISNIVLPGSLGNGERKINPYDDSFIDTKFLASSENGELNAALLAMTGSIDDNFLPDNSKASTSGFVYSNKEGTDSLAFGGLMR